MISRNRSLTQLNRLHTSKFSLQSSDLANFICWCVKKNLHMLAFEQLHLSRKKLTHCRTCLSVRVDKENLSRKLRNFGRTAVLFSWWLTAMALRFFFVVRYLIVLLATVKTCQRKLVNSFTPAKKTRQSKTRQKNLSFIHMSIWTLSITLVKEKLLVCNRL